MEFGAGTGADLKAYIVHHDWACIMQNKITPDQIYLLSLMVHLAKFNDLVLKTDNGTHGNAEHHDTEHHKCSLNTFTH